MNTLCSIHFNVIKRQGEVFIIFSPFPSRLSRSRTSNYGRKMIKGSKWENPQRFCTFWGFYFTQIDKTVIQSDCVQIFVLIRLLDTRCVTLTLLSTLSSSIQWVKLLKTRWKFRYRIYWDSSLLLVNFCSSFRGYCGVTALKFSLVEREFHCHRLGLDQKEEVSVPLLEKCCRQIRFSKYHQRTSFKFMLKRSAMSKPLIEWSFH